MITRHGRSASTVSSVRPNSEPPATRHGSVRTIELPLAPAPAEVATR
jgi:hypothetical protein